MADITIYTWGSCPFCKKAKRLLDTKGVTYKEIQLRDGEKLPQDVIQKSGGRTTVPQIFIDGVHIGGCDDIHKLDESGKLDGMIW